MNAIKEAIDKVWLAVNSRLIYRMTAVLAAIVIVGGAIIIIANTLFVRSLNENGLKAIQEKGVATIDKLLERHNARMGLYVGNYSLIWTDAVKPALEEKDILYLAFYSAVHEENNPDVIKEIKRLYPPHQNDLRHGDKLKDFPAGKLFGQFEDTFPPLPEKVEIQFREISLLYDPDVKAMDIVRQVYSKTDKETDADGNPKKPYLIGYVRLGLSTTGVYDTSGKVWYVAMIVLAILVATGISMVYFMHRVVARPITRMAKVARKISEGDFSVTVRVDSIDEVGILSNAFNEMVGSVNEQMSRTQFLLENITDTVDLITQTSSEIYSVSAQQSSGATQQAASVYEVSSTSKEIAASATRIADTAEEVASHARKTTQASESGRVEISGAVFQVKDATEQVDEVAKRIVDLGEKSQKISGIIDIINEISEQTNLLSLNAAIEASGAGEAGKRFQVVAQEIRRLAARTMDATRVVRNLIEEIQSATNTSVMVTEQAMKSTREAAVIIERLNASFQNILDLVEQTMKASTEITLSTRQQTTACEQMVTTIMEVSEVASEVEKGAKETEKAASQLRELSDGLNKIARGEVTPASSSDS